MDQDLQKSRIKPLPQEVVDRIAAGEVVQRPSSIAKELIENSVDAGSHNIEIFVCDGGLQQLIVTDDGHGISPHDLQAAATRFSTSKLAHFEDLKVIGTFGFRGEALASASMVSRLTITSRTKVAPCAYQQSYKDGKPTSVSPRPTAGNHGTLVKISDLFYNVSNRKKAFVGKEKDEYKKILEVVQRYAIHFASVGLSFTCRSKSGNTDLNTRSLPLVTKIKGIKEPSKEDSEMACKEVIEHVFGSDISHHLLRIKSSCGDVLTETKELTAGAKIPEATFTYHVDAVLTDPAYSPPRANSAFIIFINDRLVSFSSLKRALESLYSDTLSRGCKPFIYLSIRLPSWHVDVNVHPTKREVAYLFEDELIRHLVNEVREHLVQASDQKSFSINKLGDSTPRRKKETPNAALTSFEHDETTSCVKKENLTPFTPKEKKRRSHIATPSSSSRKHPKTLVRTNIAAPTGALEPFLITTPSQSLQSELLSQSSELQLSQMSDAPTSFSDKKKKNEVTIMTRHKPNCEFYLQGEKIDLSQPGAFAMICRCQVDDNRTSPKSFKVPPTLFRGGSIMPSCTDHDSVEILRKKIVTNRDIELATKIRESTFVGLVSSKLCLIQWEVELLMINHFQWASQLFYQIALKRFGESKLGSFGKSVNVFALIYSALLDDDAIENEMNIKENEFGKIAKQATSRLEKQKSLLYRYFSINLETKLNGELHLCGLPVLLESHQPEPHALPMFLLRLGTEINWDDEERCFDGICKELGYFYAETPCGTTIGKSSKVESTNEELNWSLKNNTSEAFIKHTIYPALKYHLDPSIELHNNGSVFKVASLPSLYKVFERC